MAGDVNHISAAIVIASALIGAGAGWGGVKAGVWFLRREMDRDRQVYDQFRKDIWTAIDKEREARESVDRRLAGVEAVCEERGKRGAKC